MVHFPFFSLCRRLRPVFIDRTEAWTAYARSHELLGGEIQPHDLFYVCRKEAEAHYESVRDASVRVE